MQASTMRSTVEILDLNWKLPLVLMRYAFPLVLMRYTTLVEGVENKKYYFVQ